MPLTVALHPQPLAVYHARSRAVIPRCRGNDGVRSQMNVAGSCYASSLAALSSSPASTSCSTARTVS